MYPVREKLVPLAVVSGKNLFKSAGRFIFRARGPLVFTRTSLLMVQGWSSGPRACWQAMAFVVVAGMVEEGRGERARVICLL